MDEMYCYVGDLLGFRDFILNLEEEKQEEKVEEWIRFVEETKNNYHNITHYHLVSDTIFIGSEGNQNGLDDLLHFSKSLLENGIRRGFLLRGSITFGKVKWDTRITFGKAIVDAFNLANEQNWIGTICENSFQDLSGLWDFDLVVRYPVPMKKGKIDQFPAVSWNVPSTEYFIQKSRENGLMRPEEGLTWNKHGYKIQNTRLFSMYLDKIKDFAASIKVGRVHPSQPYAGLLQTYFIEKDWEKILRATGFLKDE